MYQIINNSLTKFMIQDSCGGRDARVAWPIKIDPIQVFAFYSWVLYVKIETWGLLFRKFSEFLPDHFWQFLLCPWVPHIKEKHFAFVLLCYDLLEWPGNTNLLLLPPIELHVSGQLRGDVPHKVDLVSALILLFTFPVAGFIFLQKENQIFSNKLSFTLVPSSSSLFGHANPSFHPLVASYPF